MEQLAGPPPARNQVPGDPVIAGVYTAVDNLERAELTAFFDVKLWRDDRCTADIGPL